MSRAGVEQLLQLTDSAFETVGTAADEAHSLLSNWGEMKETGWIIRVMIEHDLYHAGEINHIRALRQCTDRWAWES